MRSPGFTLIELILVILLISVLVGLSTPLFRKTFSALQIRNVVSNTTKIINYAQEMAIIEKTNYRANFDFEKEKYWLTKYVFSENGSAYKKIGGKCGKTFSIPKGLTITGNDTEITFYPDGRSEKAEIRIIDKNKEGLLLRVKGFANRVEIKEIRNE